MADRSNFWKMVDRTKPSKLHVFAKSELRDCEDYFLETQSDSTLSPNEIITALERLILIRSEIDLRHSDARHEQTQRLPAGRLELGLLEFFLPLLQSCLESQTGQLPSMCRLLLQKLHKWQL
jgi:hypothetical protein